jgi:hypothetical protein
VEHVRGHPKYQYRTLDTLQHLLGVRVCAKGRVERYHLSEFVRPLCCHCHSDRGTPVVSTEHNREVA